MYSIYIYIYMDHICTIYIEKDLVRTHGGDEQVPRCPRGIQRQLRHRLYFEIHGPRLRVEG